MRDHNSILRDHVVLRHQADKTLLKDTDEYYVGDEVEAALQIIGKSRADSYHYTGFPNRTDTSIAFDDGTYTFTLTASDDKIWINGIEYTIDTLTKQLSVAQELVSGLYWYWITAPGGVPQLNVSMTTPDIGSGGANAGFDQCLVATVYWNTTEKEGLRSDERHWFGRDAWWHEMLHETVGAKFYKGMAGTFGNTTFQIESGEFYDEDIEHENSTETTACVLYHDGDADWAWDVATTTPYKTDGTDLQYNNGNALASAGNNRYVNYYFFITPDPVCPVHIIIGTATYTTKAAATAAALPSLGDLPSAENKLIYSVTYKNISGGTHLFQSATDFRTSSTSPSAGYVATDHGSLSNLIWADSNHTGTVSTFSGFNATGEATYYTESDYLKTTAISDTVYGAGWDTVTTIAPSKNAVYDELNDRSSRVLPLMWGGTNGWAESTNRTLYTVGNYDPNAILAANFICPETRDDWQVKLVTYTNLACTCGGVYHLGAATFGESNSSNNIVNGDNLDITYAGSSVWEENAICPVFSATKGDIIQFRWTKDDDGGYAGGAGPNTTLHCYGIILVHG